MKILKKTILVSGALLRTLIGIGAATLVYIGLKKKKERKRKRS